MDKILKYITWARMIGRQEVFILDDLNENDIKELEGKGYAVKLRYDSISRREYYKICWN